MYSQYQSYQQGHTVVAPAQQWNGTAWVPAADAAATAGAAHVNSGTFSTYSSAAGFSNNGRSSNTTTTTNSATTVANNTDKVAKYTQYYNQWHAKSEEQKQLAASLPDGNAQKAEASRQAQWADYYADQSSRCAHHYAGNTATAGTNPPEEPPAPPPLLSSSSSSPGVSSSIVATTQHHLSTQQQHPARSWASVASANTPAATVAQQQTPGGPPPGGSAVAPTDMKSYVHKCLERCTTDEQKQWVQQEVQKIIAKAITDGTLHTMNWNSLELITYPQPISSTNGVYNKRHLHQQDDGSSSPSRKKSRFDNNFHNSSSSAYSNSNHHPYDNNLPANTSYYGHTAPSPAPKGSSGNSYYGPTASSPTNKNNNRKKNSKYDTKLPVNDSYYGRSSSTVSSATSSIKDNTSDISDIDFISIPFGDGGSKKSKKKKTKNSGFQQSSHTLSKRAERFSGQGGLSQASSSSAHHANNLADRYMGKSIIGGSAKKLDDTDYERMTVKGTCTKLEKNYLRLTSPPKAELVRPKFILQQHLTNLKNEWAEPKEQRKHDYLWFCSQFKAVRQDLTVQRINDEFAVDTYETHARIALQEGDLNEYNQCQTQLKELYDSLANNVSITLPNQSEFIAYRLIYYVFLTGNKKYEGGSSDLFRIMLSLTPEQRKDPCIAHALNVRVAVAEFDYHAFFRLQDKAPKLGAHLMDFMVPNVRHWALQRICKAYRPSIPVNFALQELGFDPNDSAELTEGKEWLTSCGCVLSDDRSVLQTKDSVVHESVMNKKNSLI